MNFWLIMQHFDHSAIFDTNKNISKLIYIWYIYIMCVCPTWGQREEIKQTQMLENLSHDQDQHRRERRSRWTESQLPGVYIYGLCAGGREIKTVCNVCKFVSKNKVQKNLKKSPRLTGAKGALWWTCTQITFCSKLDIVDIDITLVTASPRPWHRWEQKSKQTTKDAIRSL